MTNQAYPSVNGNPSSWANIAVTIVTSGQPLLGMIDIKAIKWGRKVEAGEKRGASGGRVTGRTSGQGSQDGSMTLYRSGMRQLIKNLAAVAPTRGNQVRISLVAFDIMIQHTPEGDSEIYQVKLKGCRYFGDSDDMKEGTDPDAIDVTINPIEIANIINGKEVVLL